MDFSLQPNPNIQELTLFFEHAFAQLAENDSEEFDPSDSQALFEWFDILAMEYYMLQDNAILIEARDEQKLVGAVCIGKQSPIFWPNGRKVEVIILAVHPDFRQKGMGKKLMKQAEIEAKGMGGKSIVVNTHHSLKKVHDLYKKLGYEEIGVLKEYYDNGDAVFLMKKLV